MTASELKARLAHANDDAEVMIQFNESSQDVIKKIDSDLFALNICSLSICDQKCHVLIVCGDQELMS